MKTVRAMKAKQKTAERITAREKNRRAFLRLRKRYQATHHGQWIGLVDGRVAATAGTFEELRETLAALEPRISHRMVFQAGATWAQARKIVILPFV